MNEILKRRIEEAAVEYAESIPQSDERKEYSREDFIAGAEYTLSYQWISVEESLPDRKEYDWVLIQIYMDDGFMCVPKVGEIRSDGYWHCAEYDELYKIGESLKREWDAKLLRGYQYRSLKRKKRITHEEDRQDLFPS